MVTPDGAECQNEALGRTGGRCRSWTCGLIRVNSPGRVSPGSVQYRVFRHVRIRKGFSGRPVRRGFALSRGLRLQTVCWTCVLTRPRTNLPRPT